MTTIGFLHTADVHVATFGGLLTELAPECEAQHLVDDSLLASARADGLTPQLTARVRERLDGLVAGGAELIVCTCSTIGAVAEDSVASVGVPILRADRPMADAAVTIGKRIGVVVTTESTLEPTLDLLRDSAAQAAARAGTEAGARVGEDVRLVPVVAASAWRHFESGELTRYYADIAEHAHRIAPDVDVIVLAQASMAPAAHLINGPPVLTSPRSAVDAAVTRLAPPPATTVDAAVTRLAPPPATTVDAAVTRLASREPMPETKKD